MPGPNLTRRYFVTGALASCASLAPGLMTMPALADQDPDDPFQIPHFDEKKLPKEFRRAVVHYPSRHWPGTIIVNTGSRQLFVILEGQQALRFGCAVGRDGFRWAGLADVGRKVMWPRWTPPKDMIDRSPEKAKWKNGMPGGPDNPLGARALYLFQNGGDTLYRIHGTTEPMSIGKNASSGCIRMLNQDVIELYRRAPVGTRVIVMAEGL
ncbi:L,D-transpeptidase [Taklimakanibacter lacteus]|uniref:L,D-transpeptidase n=1 Tax=Taklimakanibacter lacteus TaxID=2268456 RepID=UPI0034D6ACB6